VTSSSETPDFVLLAEVSTRAEADLIVALLSTEGIQAQIVDREATDSILLGRRTRSVQVMVPASDLEAAREVVAAAHEVGLDELAQQAEALPPEEPSPWPQRSLLRRLLRRAVNPTSLAIGAAGLFLVLWLVQLSANVLLRSISAVEFRSPKSDGTFDTILSFDRSGRLVTVRRQALLDGKAREVEEHRVDGTLLLWRDHDGDGMFDSLEVRDAGGLLLRTLRYVPGAGFVPE